MNGIISLSINKLYSLSTKNETIEYRNANYFQGVKFSGTWNNWQPLYIPSSVLEISDTDISIDLTSDGGAVFLAGYTYEWFVLKFKED